jgi:pilus assembly protein CpaF
MRTDLRERVRTRLVAQSQEATLTNVANALRSEGVVLGDEALRDAVRALNDHMHGAGHVQVLLTDRDVTD